MNKTFKKYKGFAAIADAFDYRDEHGGEGRILYPHGHTQHEHDLACERLCCPMNWVILTWDESLS